jgi:hypothetical protein
MGSSTLGTTALVRRGRYVSYDWDEKEYQALRPTLAVLDQLIENLLRNATEDGKAAYDALVGVIQARASLFTDKLEFNVTDPDGRSMIVGINGAMPEVPPEKAEAPIRPDRRV